MVIEKLGYLGRIFVLSIAVLIISTIIGSLSTKKAWASVAGDNLIITEIEYDLSTNENESEWFELYNPTAFAIDLTGWTISEGSTPVYTFPSVSILAGSYLVVANDLTEFQTRHPTVTPNLEMDSGGTGLLRLNNTGDELTLRDGPVLTSSVVDYIAWENFSAGWSAGATIDLSICRTTEIDTDLPADLSSNCIPTPGSGTYSSTVLVELNSIATTTAGESQDISPPELIINGLLNSNQTVDITDLGTGTTDSSDYLFSSPQTITIPTARYADGLFSLPLISVVDDNDDEVNETANFQITNPTGQFVLGDSNLDSNIWLDFSHTIIDNDETEEPTIVSATVTEEKPPTVQQPQLASTGIGVNMIRSISSIVVIFIALSISKKPDSSNTLETHKITVRYTS